MKEIKNKINREKSMRWKLVFWERLIKLMGSSQAKKKKRGHKLLTAKWKWEDITANVLKNN